jgi:hypothetical protein
MRRRGKMVSKNGVLPSIPEAVWRKMDPHLGGQLTQLRLPTGWIVVGDYCREGGSYYSYVLYEGPDEAEADRVYAIAAAQRVAMREWL